jgi:hypothetical protein
MFDLVVIKSYQNTCGNGVQAGLNLIRYTHKRTARF